MDGFDGDRIDPNGSGHVLIRMFRSFARDSENQTLVDADLSFRGSDQEEEGEDTKFVVTIWVSG